MQLQTFTNYVLKAKLQITKTFTEWIFVYHLLKKSVLLDLFNWYFENLTFPWESNWHQWAGGKYVMISICQVF